MPAKETCFGKYYGAAYRPRSKQRVAKTESDNIARAGRILALLIVLGLISLAAVLADRLEVRKCGPFTIGRSAIGSCDWIGR